MALESWLCNHGLWNADWGIIAVESLAVMCGGHLGGIWEPSIHAWSSESMPAALESMPGALTQVPGALNLCLEL